MEWIDIIQEPWAIRALLASVTVGLMCGVLGAFIVLRNMSLVGDALAHAILPGVVVAYILVGYSTLAFFAGAVVAGLLTAVGITWIQHRGHTRNDAAIGIVFTAMFSLGVMGISRISRQEGVHLDLKDFLFGNVLGVSDADLWLTGLVAIYVLLSLVIFYRYFLVTTFQEVIARTMGIDVRLVHYYLMLLLSFAVVASLQMVGVILVVAMLISPAATALLLSHRMKTVLVLSGLLGVLSAVAGLWLAIAWETTPGPAMAVTATCIYLLAAIFAPGKGLLYKYLAKRSLHRKVASEDMLKAAYHSQQAEGAFDEQQWRHAANLSASEWSRQKNRLGRKGWLNASGSGLSEKGAAEAERLVRAHRLWETYLARQVGVDIAHIHTDAEHYEHLLTEEMLEEVDASLGYPSTDPHGSPIPAKGSREPLLLTTLTAGQQGLLAEQQSSEHVSAQLWQLGLMPGCILEMNARTGSSSYQVALGGKLVELPAELAAEVVVFLVKA